MATESPIIMSQLYQPQSRPNSLLIPSNPAYGPLSPRGGILMNANRSLLSPNTPSYGYSSGLNTPRSPSPLSAAFSPDASKLTESRKIRFAPLPDPRREVLIDEDGAEVPCLAPPDATAFPLQSPGAGSSVPLDRTDSLVTDSGASTTSTDAETQSQISRKRAKRNSLLRLFGVKGSTSIPKRTSTCSLPAADANGTIGGIPVPGLGLFRPTSRESWSGELSGYTSDNSMARRTSSPLRPSSAGGRPQPNYGTYGAPLMHATSDGSGTARPQRMLNGRVYGARRAKERLQPLPSMEPEFSEWGYGGMGSVNTTGEYSKLQSKTSAVSGGDDDDDGSGMAWIKKRKEKREQEARERKEAEAAAAAKAQEPSPERASTDTTDSVATVQPERTETPTIQTPTNTAPPSRQNSTPMPRTRSVSRQNSAGTVTANHHYPTVVEVPAQGHRGRPEATVLHNGVAMSPETSPERSSSGSSSRSSSDDEDAEGSSSTTGRDEEEEEEEEEQKRITALSAGIEKISRHHA